LNNQTSRTGGDTSGADVNIAQRKREEQGSTMASSGKPTGYGKELDEPATIEFKEMMGQDAELVDPNTFRELYYEDRTYNSIKPPRIFMRENDMFISLKYKSTDFVYKTVINKEDIDNYKIMLYDLSSNIYRV